MDNSNIRVLYVGYTLAGDEDATGNTLYQIFCDAPHIQVMQYCLDYDPNHHATVFDSVYTSPKKSKLYCWLKNIYRSRGNSTVGDLVTGNAERKGNVLVAVAKAIMDSLYKGVDEEAYRKIDDFAPQAIYTLGENITTLKHAIQLSKRYRIPIVMHVMDDIESRIYGYTKFTYPWRKRYLSLLKKAYSSSLVNLAISPKMAREYEQRYDKPFDFAMNCIDELHLQPEPHNEPLRMVFSGGLHGGRAETIARIADIIRKNVQLNNKITLIVHTSEGNIRMYKGLLNDKVELLPYVPKEEMFANLGKADILLHVESFNPEEIDFFRLSMSTKIPECMSVGRPIFCYGPTEICTVSYIKDKGVGLVAETDEEVVISLLNLTADENLRHEIGCRALEVAKEHLKNSVQKRVYDVLQKSVEEYR